MNNDGDEEEGEHHRRNVFTLDNEDDYNYDLEDANKNNNNNNNNSNENLHHRTTEHTKPRCGSTLLVFVLVVLNEGDIRHKHG